MIFNRFDTCRPKVMLTGASCLAILKVKYGNDEVTRTT